MKRLQTKLLKQHFVPQTRTALAAQSLLPPYRVGGGLHRPTCALAAQSPVRRHWVGEHVVVIEPPLPPLSLFLNFVGIIGRSVSVGVFVVVECYHSRFSQGDRL